MGIRLSEIRAVARVVGECRELGDDAVFWRQHLFGQLNRLVGADLVIGGEMAGCLHGPLTSPGTTAWGFEQGYSIEGWRVMMEWFAQDPFISILFREYIHKLRCTGQSRLTVPRQQLLDNRQWERTPDFQILGPLLSVDAFQHSFCELPETADEFSGVLLMRETGRRTFNEHEVALVDLLHQEIAQLIGGPLARWNEPSPSQLSLRVRQALRCLLEGDGDKQIAARLQLSQHTVNQYTKQVYRHFGVAGRVELLARWVRRGWSGKAAWDTKPPPPTIRLN